MITSRPRARMLGTSASDCSSIKARVKPTGATVEGPAGAGSIACASVPEWRLTKRSSYGGARCRDHRPDR
jgi:hypothetical protein